MIFYDNSHEKAYNDVLGRMKSHDCYHRSMAYLLALDTACKEHIDAVYSFADDSIKPEALTAAWQTGTSTRLTRLAFNLWNGYCTDKSGQISSDYAVDSIFCDSLAIYYVEAVKIRFSF